MGLEILSSLGLMLKDSLEKFVDTEMPESILDFRLPELVLEGDLGFSFDGDLFLFFFSFFFFLASPLE